MGKKLKRVPLKEELVALTGCFIKALILQQFLYWSERVSDFDEFIIEEKERNPDLPLELRYGWIYKSTEQLHEELMFGESLSPRTLKRRLDEIVDSGYLDSRHNPEYRWDRCLQYRPNILKIQVDLQALGYALDGYPLTPPAFVTVTNAYDTVSNQLDSLSNRTVAGVQAIPETTIETTTEKEERGIKINFDLPPLEHSKLLNKWVYVKQDKDLVKGFVIKVTPKRLKIALEGQDGTRIINPVDQVFYQNGHPELSPVKVGKVEEASDHLTESQLAMKNRLIDLTRADELITESERVQAISKIQEAAIFMVNRGDTPQDVDSFEKWFTEDHWRGQEGEIPSLKVLSNLWSEFRKSQNGHQTESTYTPPNMTEEMWENYRRMSAEVAAREGGQ